MKNGSIAIMAVGYRLGHVFLDRLGRSARARSCPGALLCPYVAGRASRCRGTHFGDPDGRIRRMAGKVASQVASWLRVSFSKTLLVFHGTLLVVLCRDNIEAMRAHRAGLLAEHWDVHALERASGYLTELLHMRGLAPIARRQKPTSDRHQSHYQASQAHPYGIGPASQ
jgi:hypothetical protein